MVALGSYLQNSPAILVSKSISEAFSLSFIDLGVKFFSNYGYASVYSFSKPISCLVTLFER